MEWLADPSIWMGLATLVVLEIVLGIDNLVFIAILADKLPPHQRDRARVIGLALALLMRLVLLAALAWIMKLTEPLVTLFDHSFSGRDLILLHRQRGDAERMQLLSHLLETPVAQFHLPSLDAAYDAYYASGLNTGRLEAYGQLLALLADGKALSP